MGSEMTKEIKAEDHASLTEDDNGPPFKGVLSGAAAGVAVLTTLSFVASVGGEWAYYLGLGATDFLSLASPADIISGALLWLPAMLLGWVVGTVISRMPWLLIVDPRQPYPSEEIAQRSRRREGYVVFTVTLVTLFVMARVWHVRTGGNFAWPWLLPGGACWIIFSSWFNRHPHVRYYRPARTWAPLLVFGPVVIACILATGRDQAVRDLALQRGEYRIVHSTDLVEDDVQLLRATSKGVLILRVATRDISFFTYGSFKSIDKIGHPQEERPPGR